MCVDDNVRVWMIMYVWDLYGKLHNIDSKNNNIANNHQ